MYTTSEERFEKIRSEAAKKDQYLITQSTSLEDGAKIKDWVIGKHCGEKDQRWARAARRSISSSYHRFQRRAVIACTPIFRRSSFPRGRRTSVRAR